MGIIRLEQVIFEICLDPDPDDPRSWDNLGTMICWHRRYQLGDWHDYVDPKAFRAEIHDGNAVILPVFLFDHSGLTLSTSCEIFRAFDAVGWDWGQLGYIFAFKADICQAYRVKRLTPALIAQVQEVLRDEVAVYNKFVQGDVYSYLLTDRRTGDVVDACTGFFGDNPHTNGMAEHLPATYREEILSSFYRDAA